MIITTIDWETLGLQNNSYLLSFGYIIGKTTSGEILDSNEIIVPHEYNYKFNRRIDPDTILWWINKAIQSDPGLIHNLTNYIEIGKLSTIDLFIDQLNGFIDSLIMHSVDYLFCTDKNFDYSFLQHVCTDLGIDIPLEYKRIFETRYFSEISHKEIFTKAKDNPNIQKHSPVGDCTYLFDVLCNII